MTRSSTRRVLDDEGARQRDLAAIHIAKKALGWTDDDYRHILFTVCSVRSAAELDFAGRKRFLDHLRACGWADKGAERKGFRGRQGKIWSLWQQLADAKVVRDRRLGALDLWVHSQVGVRKMVWLNEQQQDLVIERLKMWARRMEAEASNAA